MTTKLKTIYICTARGVGGVESKMLVAGDDKGDSLKKFRAWLDIAYPGRVSAIWETSAKAQQKDGLPVSVIV